MNGMIEANFNKAKEEAGRLLYRHQIYEPPVIPQDLGDRMGLAIKYIKLEEEFKNIAGYLDINKRVIFVNSDDSPNRQNFTVAHELGHWVLHKEQFLENPNESVVLLRQSLDKNVCSSAIEQEANCFAANLLVPNSWLLKYRDFANIKQLARLFMVSEDVVRFTLESL